MDRNTVIGFSLIFLILIGYYWYTAPTPEQQAAFQRQQDSLAKIEAAQASPSKSATAADASVIKKDIVVDSALTGTLGSMATQLKGESQFVTLKSKQLSVDIRTKGGNIGKVVLNNHKRSDSSALELLSNLDAYNQWFFELYTANGTLNSGDFYWQAIKQTPNSVTLRLGDSARYIDQTYTLDENGYTVKHSLALKGIDELVKSRTSGIKVFWRAQLHKQERDMKWESQNTTVVYKMSGEDADKLDVASPDADISLPLWWLIQGFLPMQKSLGKRPKSQEKSKTFRLKFTWIMSVSRSKNMALTITSVQTNTIPCRKHLWVRPMPAWNASFHWDGVFLVG
jgi:YidC/Oxa1 family membrane protein insertase